MMVMRIMAATHDAIAPSSTAPCDAKRRDRDWREIVGELAEDRLEVVGVAAHLAITASVPFRTVPSWPSSSRQQRQLRLQDLIELFGVAFKDFLDRQRVRSGGLLWSWRVPLWFGWRKFRDRGLKVLVELLRGRQRRFRRAEAPPRSRRPSAAAPSASTNTIDPSDKRDRAVPPRVGMLVGRRKVRRRAVIDAADGAHAISSGDQQIRIQDAAPLARAGAAVERRGSATPPPARS
jgi:hypothetical protein